MHLIWLSIFLGVLHHQCQSVISQTNYPGTTENIKDIFIGRCYDYNDTKYKDLLPRVGTKCPELWSEFFEAFSFRPPCAVAQSEYAPFLNSAKQELPKDKVMFWSGVYNLAHRFSDFGIRYITLEDTLIGYLANSLVWCGQGSAPGMNYTRCPAWNDCPSEASESFWAGASKTFASEAKGEVTLMVDGSNPDKPAYRNQSFFGKFELGNLNQNQVTKVNVIVTHALDKPKAETCDSGSLQVLMEEVKKRGFDYMCEDNPEAVLHILCSDDVVSRECQLAIAHAAGQLKYDRKPAHFNKMPDFIA